MFEKIKRFLKNYGLITLIIFAILFLFVLVIIVLLQDEDSELRKNGHDTIDEIPDDKLSEFLLVRQPLGFHKNYTIYFTGNVLNRLDQKQEEYPGFMLKQTTHLDWVENFVEDINKGNMEYTKSELTAEKSTHYWEKGEDMITYSEDRGTLFMKFQQPIYIPKIDFNPRDVDNLERNLNNLATNYFSPRFEYEINEIGMEGNYYRVEYSRTLGEYPIYLELPREYLLLTPDGRLKGGMFLLAEFLEYTGMQYPLISSENLRANVSLREYPKNVEFKNLAPEIEEEFYTHGFAAFSNPFKQEGEIEINSMELVYFYTGMSQEIVVPTFLFKGSGLLDVNGSLEEADFTVVANALDLEYVHIPPDSYFDVLESLE